MRSISLTLIITQLYDGEEQKILGVKKAGDGFQLSKNVKVSGVVAMKAMELRMGKVTGKQGDVWGLSGWKRQCCKDSLSKTVRKK